MEGPPTTHHDTENPGTRTAGWRPRERDRTEDTIVRTAYRLFGEQGYDETTVEQIAAASGISTQTFHRYFASKDMTLAINGFRTVERALESLEPDASISDCARRLAEATERSTGYGHAPVTRLLVEHPEVQRALPVWRTRWADHLADGLAAAAGREEPTESDQLRAQMAVTIVGISVEERVRLGGEPDLCQLTEETLLVLDAGLRGSPEAG